VRQLVLQTKVYNTNQLKQISILLKTNIEGIDAKTELSVDENWVRASLSGEDEAIAANYIRREIGLCPETWEKLKRFDNLKGYLREVAGNSDKLNIDIGVFKPENILATVPLIHLQAVLVDGRKIALKKIAELFGLSDGLPLNIKITALDKVKKQIEADLATTQLERFNTWQESLLDRLVVFGAALSEIHNTLKYTGLSRDIVGVETLGMFEHALTCKLGTDAAGLLSIIGRELRTSKFVIFNPRKIRDFLIS
jgi:hypothetical protein